MKKIEKTKLSEAFTIRKTNISGELKEDTGKEKIFSE
jgi:hypothetical protein